MSEYLVTVKDATCLDEFYADMEFRGYTRTIRKPLSRSTGFELTDEQKNEVVRDSRVLDVELRNPPNVVTKLLGAVNYEPYPILGDFTKTSVTSSTESDQRQWGHVSHAGTTAQRSYGSNPGSPDYTTWNSSTVNERVDVFNKGKHVDIVICDSPVGPDHAEWISDETGLSRFVEYDWYAQHNAQVIGGLDSDGLSSPGSNYTYANATALGQEAYHGTHVMSTAGGRYYGWAKEANLYNINLFPTAVSGQTQMSTELMYDYIRAFHRNKPINPVTGFKNPTIVNCSYSSGYDLSETYPGGVQASNVYGVYHKGETYDDGVMAYDGNAGTTPLGLKGVLSSWSSTELRRIFGIYGYDFPYYSTSNGADLEDCIADGVVICKAQGNDDSPRSGDHHKSSGTLYSNDLNMRENIAWLDNGWALRYCRVENPYAPGVICVGALTTTVNYTSSNPYPPYGSIPVSFSNRGIDTHVWAAGTVVTGTYPPSSGGVQDTKPGYVSGIDFFKSISGTSMASPQVCGVLACYATGRERFNSADAKRYLEETSNKTEMFTDNWAKNYASTTRKTHPITITVDPTNLTVTGQDRRSNLYQLTSGGIRVEALDTINFTLPIAENHKWRLVKGSSTGLTNTDIDNPSQYPHLIQAVESGGAISWTPSIDDVGYWYIVCGCSLLPNHDNQPNAHSSRNQVQILVEPPACWDDQMNAGGSSKYLLQAKNTRPSTGLMSEWCHDKGYRWGLGRAGYYLNHRGNIKNRALVTDYGGGESIWPRQNTLNRAVPSSSYYSTAITHPDGSTFKAYGHANDSEGNLYVVGSILVAETTPGTGIDGVIYKLDQAGNVVKSVQYNPSTGSSTCHFNGVVVDDDDYIYVHATSSVVIKFNTELVQQWQTQTLHGNGYGNISQDNIDNGGSIMQSSSSIIFAGYGYSGWHVHTVNKSDGQATASTYGGTNGQTMFYGANVINNTMYFCGWHSNGHPSDYFWAIAGSNGRSSSYQFYNVGNTAVARCIAKDTTNNRTYIAGDMGGKATIMRFDSYNTNTTGQGSVWWKESTSTQDIMDIAIDKDHNPVFAAGGAVVKINPSGTVLWAKSVGGTVNKIRIDSDNNMWITCNNTNTSQVTVVKAPASGVGLPNTTYTLSGRSYQHQDYGQITTGFAFGSTNGMSQWGNISSNAAGGYFTNFTPTDVKSPLAAPGTLGYISSGEALYQYPGSYQWICPSNVYQVSVVCVGGGGAGSGDGHSTTGGAGGGGGLGYKNAIDVTPGQTYTVQVGNVAAGGGGANGGDSYFINSSTVSGLGGAGDSGATGGAGGSWQGDGGGTGGKGGDAPVGSYEAGGGGAGGYGGTGGAGGGGDGSTHPDSTPLSTRKGEDGTNGAGGGGGYGGGYIGGGVGVYGRGTIGLGAAYNNPEGVPWGSGEAGSAQTLPVFGAGGSGAGAEGKTGGVRIMWGPNRSFPTAAAKLT